MSSMQVSTSLAAWASSRVLPPGSTGQSMLRSSWSMVNSSAPVIASLSPISR